MLLIGQAVWWTKGALPGAVSLWDLPQYPG